MRFQFVKKVGRAIHWTALNVRSLYRKHSKTNQKWKANFHQKYPRETSTTHCYEPNWQQQYNFWVAEPALADIVACLNNNDKKLQQVGLQLAYKFLYARHATVSVSVNTTLAPLAKEEEGHSDLLPIKDTEFCSLASALMDICEVDKDATFVNPFDSAQNCRSKDNIDLLVSVSNVHQRNLLVVMGYGLLTLQMGVPAEDQYDTFCKLAEHSSDNSRLLLLDQVVSFVRTSKTVLGVRLLSFVRDLCQDYNYILEDVVSFFVAIFNQRHKDLSAEIGLLDHIFKSQLGPGGSLTIPDGLPAVGIMEHLRHDSNTAPSGVACALATYISHNPDVARGIRLLRRIVAFTPVVTARMDQKLQGLLLRGIHVTEVCEIMQRDGLILDNPDVVRFLRGLVQDNSIHSAAVVKLLDVNCELAANDEMENEDGSITSGN